ncbi:hypothetical protein [Thalassolituus sp.]|jgi:hypothetical protein|uniref:hypothetical protein n=1 Tax=Thalassolituus sp. TaxID=2030822 RepID=UPI002A82D4AA|nr:hypothetical protein [Thalassolituus sp.]
MTDSISRLSADARDRIGDEGVTDTRSGKTASPYVPAGLISAGLGKISRNIEHIKQ